MDRAALLSQFWEKGWVRFDKDPVLENWLAHAIPAAYAAIIDPENAHWLRYGGTWFAGVNALPNDSTGALAGGPPLHGNAVDFIRESLGFGDLAWDRAQISVCYPGYPRPAPDESEALFRYRRDKDAAHVDGLHRAGAERRRFLREHHAFILGLPISAYSKSAAPFTVWEGSHRLVGDALRAFYADAPPECWSEIDVTETYHSARRRSFETCPRAELHASPGQAILAHRHILHGMGRWQEEATADETGRAILYFRPEMGSWEDWLANRGP
ncbi:MAG: hypothetical protein QNJ84_15060 [Alphaproteobacteria bacterium]|nr:hypothetical protein [Alphaproteobacteria bacterium]